MAVRPLNCGDQAMFLERFKRVRNRFLIRLDMTFRPHGRPKKQHNGSCAG